MSAYCDPYLPERAASGVSLPVQPEGTGFDSDAVNNSHGHIHHSLTSLWTGVKGRQAASLARSSQLAIYIHIAA
jgi:hypothetical protein